MTGFNLPVAMRLGADGSVDVAGPPAGSNDGSGDRERRDGYVRMTRTRQSIVIAVLPLLVIGGFGLSLLSLVGELP